MSSKLILCDSRESMYNKFKILADELSNKNRWDLEIEAVHGDVFEIQKQNQGYKICTASNPNFTFGGGLDLAIAQNFPEEIGWAKEFSFTDNLFFLVTVNNSLQATKEILQRALVGVLGYRHENLILTGIGTGIGGLSEDELVDLIRADLICADLEGDNLRDANLSYADLEGANLRGADLRDANLSYANLRGADLIRADLSYANLRGADLIRADLIRANLSYADLRGANLSYANLRDANLSYADLRGADLRDADLIRADLRGADLRDADYSDTTRFSTYFICPESGNFIAWKATRNYICQLEIIGDRTSNLINRKCRTNKAKILGFYNIDKELLSDVTSDNSKHDSTFIYKLGEIVEVPNWSNDFRIDCAEGIHFFITFAEAKEWLRS